MPGAAQHGEQPAGVVVGGGQRAQPGAGAVGGRGVPETSPPGRG